MGRPKKTAPRKATAVVKVEPVIRKRIRPICFNTDKATTQLARDLSEGKVNTVAEAKERLTAEGRDKPTYLEVVAAFVGCANEDDTVEFVRWFDEVCPEHLASTEKVNFESVWKMTPSTALLAKAARMSFDLVGNMNDDDVKVAYANKSLEFALERGLPLPCAVDTVVGAMIRWTPTAEDPDQEDKIKAVLHALKGGSPWRVAAELPVFGTLKKYDARIQGVGISCAAVVQKCTVEMADLVKRLTSPSSLCTHCWPDIHE